MDLDDVAKQVEFAKLVGASQPAIANHLSVGTLEKSASYREWLLAYCEKLRLEASGREVNKVREQLEIAKTRDALASARTKELALYRDEQLVLDYEQTKSAMLLWINQAKNEYVSSVDKILDRIESQYSIDLDRESFHGIVDASARTLADFSFEFEAPD